MDVAIACFTRAALKTLVGWLQQGRLRLPEHSMLVRDYDAVVAGGSRTQVTASHLSLPSGTTRSEQAVNRLLLNLLEHCEPYTPNNQRHYLKLVEARLRKGNLSEKILQRLNTKSGKSASRQSGAIHDIYSELADCLETNTPWQMYAT